MHYNTINQATSKVERIYPLPNQEQNEKAVYLEVQAISDCFLPRETPADCAIADGVEAGFLDPKTKKLTQKYSEYPLPEGDALEEIYKNINGLLAIEIRSGLTLRQYLIDQRDKAAQHFNEKGEPGDLAEKKPKGPIKYFKIIGTKAHEIAGERYIKALFHDAGLETIYKAGERNLKRKPHDSDLRTHFSKKYRKGGQQELKFEDVDKLRTQSEFKIGHVKNNESWFDPNIVLKIRGNEIDYAVGNFKDFNLFNNSRFHIAIDADSLGSADPKVPIPEKVRFKLVSKGNMHRQAFADQALGIISDEDSSEKNYTALIGLISGLIRGKKCYDPKLYQDYIKNHYKEFKWKLADWPKKLATLIQSDVSSHVDKLYEALILELFQFELLLEDAPSEIRSAFSQPLLDEAWRHIVPPGSFLNHPILNLRLRNVPAKVIAAAMACGSGLSLSLPGRLRHDEGTFFTPYLTEQLDRPAIEYRASGNLKFYYKWDPANALKILNDYRHFSKEIAEIIVYTCPLNNATGEDLPPLERYAKFLAPIDAESIVLAEANVRSNDIHLQMAGLSVLVQAYTRGQKCVESFLFGEAFPKLICSTHPTYSVLAQNMAGRILYAKTPNHLHHWLNSVFTKKITHKDWYEALITTGIKEYAQIATKHAYNIPKGVRFFSNWFLSRLLSIAPEEGIRFLHSSLVNGKQINERTLETLKNCIKNNSRTIQSWNILLDIADRLNVDIGVNPENIKEIIYRLDSKDYIEVADSLLKHCRETPRLQILQTTAEFITSKRFEKACDHVDVAWGTYLSSLKDIPESIYSSNKWLSTATGLALRWLRRTEKGGIEEKEAVQVVLQLIEKCIRGNPPMPFDKSYHLIESALCHYQFKDCPALSELLFSFCEVYIEQTGIPTSSLVHLLELGLKHNPQLLINSINEGLLIQIAHTLLQEEPLVLETPYYASLNQLMNIIEALLSKPNSANHTSWELLLQRVRHLALHTSNSDVYRLNARLASEELSNDYLLEALYAEIKENNDNATKTFLSLYVQWDTLTEKQKERLKTLAILICQTSSLPPSFRSWLNDGKARENFGNVWIECLLKALHLSPNDQELLDLLNGHILTTKSPRSPSTCKAAQLLLNTDRTWSELVLYYPHLDSQGKQNWERQVQRLFNGKHDIATILVHENCPSSIQGQFRTVLRSSMDKKEDEEVCQLVDKFKNKLTEQDWEDVWKWALKRRLGPTVQAIYTTWSNLKTEPKALAYAVTAITNPASFVIKGEEELLQLIQEVANAKLTDKQLIQAYIALFRLACEKNYPQAIENALTALVHEKATPQLLEDTAKQIFAGKDVLPSQLNEKSASLLFTLIHHSESKVGNPSPILHWLTNLGCSDTNMDQDKFRIQRDTVALVLYAVNSNFKAEDHKVIYQLAQTYAENREMDIPVAKALNRLVTREKDSVQLSDAETALQNLLNKLFEKAIRGEPEFDFHIVLDLFIDYRNSHPTSDKFANVNMFRAIDILVGAFLNETENSKTFRKYVDLLLEKAVENRINFENYFCAALLKGFVSEGDLIRTQWEVLHQRFMYLLNVKRKRLTSNQLVALLTHLDRFFFHPYLLTDFPEDLVRGNMALLKKVFDNKWMWLESFKAKVHLFTPHQNLMDIKASPQEWFSYYIILVELSKKKVAALAFAAPIVLFERVLPALSKAKPAELCNWFEKVLEMTDNVAGQTVDGYIKLFKLLLVYFTDSKIKLSHQEKLHFLALCKKIVEKFGKDSFKNVYKDSAQQFNEIVLLICHLSSNFDYSGNRKEMADAYNAILTASHAFVLNALNHHSPVVLNSEKTLFMRELIRQYTWVFFRNPFVEQRQQATVEFIKALKDSPSSSCTSFALMLLMEKRESKRIFKCPTEIYDYFDEELTTNLAVACILTEETHIESIRKYFKFFNRPNMEVQKLHRSTDLLIQIAGVHMTELKEKSERQQFRDEFEAPLLEKLEHYTALEDAINPSFYLSMALTNSVLSLGRPATASFYITTCRKLMALSPRLKRQSDTLFALNKNLIDLTLNGIHNNFFSSDNLEATQLKEEIQKYLANVNVSHYSAGVASIILEFWENAQPVSLSEAEKFCLYLKTCDDLLEQGLFNTFEDMLSLKNVLQPKDHHFLIKKAIKQTLKHTRPEKAAFYITQMQPEFAAKDPQIHNMTATVVIELLENSNEPAKHLQQLLPCHWAFKRTPKEKMLKKLCEGSQKLTENDDKIKIWQMVLLWCLNSPTSCSDRFLLRIIAHLQECESSAHPLIHTYAGAMLDVLTTRNLSSAMIHWLRLCMQANVPVDLSAGRNQAYGIALKTAYESDKEILPSLAQYAKKNFDALDRNAIDLKTQLTIALEIAHHFANKKNKAECLSWTTRFTTLCENNPLIDLDPDLLGQCTALMEYHKERQQWTLSIKIWKICYDQLFFDQDRAANELANILHLALKCKQKQTVLDLLKAYGIGLGFHNPQLEALACSVFSQINKVSELQNILNDCLATIPCKYLSAILKTANLNSTPLALPDFDTLLLNVPTADQSEIIQQYIVLALHKRIKQKISIDDILQVRAHQKLSNIDLHVLDLQIIQRIEKPSSIAAMAQVLSSYFPVKDMKACTHLGEVLQALFSKCENMSFSEKEHIASMQELARAISASPLSVDHFLISTCLFKMGKNFEEQAVQLFETGFSKIKNKQRPVHYFAALNQAIAYKSGDSDWTRKHLNTHTPRILSTNEYEHVLSNAMVRHSHLPKDASLKAIKDRLDLILDYFEKLPSPVAARLLSRFVRFALQLNDTNLCKEYIGKINTICLKEPTKGKLPTFDEGLTHGKLASCYWKHNRALALQLALIEESLRLASRKKTSLLFYLELAHLEFKKMLDKGVSNATVHAFFHLLAASAAYNDKVTWDYHMHRCNKYFADPLNDPILKHRYLSYMRDFLNSKGEVTICSSPTEDELRKTFLAIRQSIHNVFQLMPQGYSWNHLFTKYQLLSRFQSDIYKIDDKDLISKYILIIEETIVLLKESTPPPRNVLNVLNKILLGKIVYPLQAKNEELNTAFIQLIKELFNFLDKTNLETCDKESKREYLECTFVFLTQGFKLGIFSDPKHAATYYQLICQWINHAPQYIESTHLQANAHLLINHIAFATAFMTLDPQTVPSWKRSNYIDNDKLARTKDWFVKLGSLHGVPAFFAKYTLQFYAPIKDCFRGNPKELESTITTVKSMYDVQNAWSCDYILLNHALANMNDATTYITPVKERVAHLPLTILE